MLLTSISDGDDLKAEGLSSTGSSRALCSLAPCVSSLTPVFSKVLRGGVAVEACSAASGAACSKDDIHIDGAKPARNVASSSGHVLSADGRNAASMVLLVPQAKINKSQIGCKELAAHTGLLIESQDYENA